MTFKTFTLFISLALYSVSAIAKPTTVKADSEEFAGQEIEFFALDDAISGTEIKLGKVKVNALGEFEIKLNLEATTQIYCYIGIYKGTFYAEQGKEYELVLPPRQDISLVDELNPYFVHELIKLGVKNADEKELNYAISQFDHQYDSFLTENFNWLYIKADIKLVDSISKVFDSKYGKIKNEFLQTYIYYKMAGLRYFTYERDVNFVCHKYLLNKPFPLHNEAYSVFFNQLFTDFITVKYTDGIGKDLYESIIYYKSPQRMKEVLDKKISFRNDTLKELIILKGLYDAYSRPDIYPRNTVDQTLDSMRILCKNPYILKTAENIFAKTDRVLVGDRIENVSGLTPEGDSLHIDSMLGKFVYLVFCRSENYACMQDYRLITDLHTQLPKEEIQILTISFDQDYNTFKDYLGRNKNYNWQFAYSSDKSLLELFNIKAMPAYILVDPDGNIALNPAPSPHENFQHYFAMMIKWRERSKKMQADYLVPQD